MGRFMTFSSRSDRPSPSSRLQLSIVAKSTRPFFATSGSTGATPFGRFSFVSAASISFVSSSRGSSSTATAGLFFCFFEPPAFLRRLPPSPPLPLEEEEAPNPFPAADACAADDASFATHTTKECAREYDVWLVRALDLCAPFPAVRVAVEFEVALRSESEAMAAHVHVVVSGAERGKGRGRGRESVQSDEAASLRHLFGHVGARADAKPQTRKRSLFSTPLSTSGSQPVLPSYVTPL